MIYCLFSVDKKMAKKEKWRQDRQPAIDVGGAPSGPIIPKTWKREKARSEKTADLSEVFLNPQEEINKMKDKFLPIQSGKIRFFNAIKGKGFIKPNGWSQKYIYMQDTERIFKDWEDVHYIVVNHEAMVTQPWRVRVVTERRGTEHKTRKLGYVFVTPNDIEKKDVVAKNSDKETNLDEYKAWDMVEFVANKKWDIVAIQKTEE